MGLYELLLIARDPQHNPTYLANEVEKFFSKYSNNIRKDCEKYNILNETYNRRWNEKEG